jgi:hypothetical protein
MTDIVERLAFKQGFGTTLSGDEVRELYMLIESLRQQRIEADAIPVCCQKFETCEERCIPLVRNLRQQLDDASNALDICEQECRRMEVRIAECQAQNTKLSERVVGIGEIAINSVSRDRLAECQAREKVRIEKLQEIKCAYSQDYSNPDSAALSGCPIDAESVVDEALAILSDSTALDTMLKSAKREALLEAETFFLNNIERRSWVADELRRMAEELE